MQVLISKSLVEFTSINNVLEEEEEKSKEGIKKLKS